MSSRALRKAQKKQIAQQLDPEIQDDENESSENEPAPTSKPSIFALLSEAGDGDEADQDEQQQEDVDSPAPENETTTEISQPATPKSSNKKKRKKKKGKTVTPAPDSEQSFDFEPLNQLSMKDDTPSRGSSSYEELCRLLAVSQHHLHVLNEMKSLFGRDVIEAEQREARAEVARARRGGAAAVNNRLANIARRRNLFIQGQEEWPTLPSGGLRMEIVNKEPNGVVEYRFAHSTAYQDVQRQFEICVQSMDPSRMIVLLQQNPWHIATLLQVSDIAKQSRQHSDAGHLLERALFCFGRSVHSTFAEKLSQGKARLDFRRPENREFWLASWRYIDNLKMRATWRTVYEWAKMLLSLDPEKDPYCIKLVIDQFAMRANETRHFLELTSTLSFNQAVYTSFGLDDLHSPVADEEEEQEGARQPYDALGAILRGNLSAAEMSKALQNLVTGKSVEEEISYPYANIAATKALALLQLGTPLVAGKPDINQELATRYLVGAMAAAPWLFARLFQELQIDPIPPSIWGKQPPGPNEDLASKLYVSRAKDIWNTPEAMSLLIKVAKGLQLEDWKPELEPPIPLFEQAGPVRHVVLHVMLTEQPQFISLLPSQPTSEQLRASDPYPPVNNVLSYDPRPSGQVLRSMHRAMSDWEAERIVAEQGDEEGIMATLDDFRRRLGLANRGEVIEDDVEDHAPGHFRMPGGMYEEEEGEQDSGE